MGMRACLSDAIEIIYEDDDFVVANKPTGMPTTPSGKSSVSLIERVQHQIASKALHATSRLDGPVSGVVTFSKSTRATQHVLGARTRGRYRRLYVALMASASSNDPVGQGVWRQAIALDPVNKKNRLAIEPAIETSESKGSKHAETRYAEHSRVTVSTRQDLAVFKLEPITGRTHQLRVHAAHAGWPIFGDRAYGQCIRITRSDGRMLEATRVMLHCTWVQLPNPNSQSEFLRFFAAIPSDMRQVWQSAGGLGGALEFADFVFDQF